MARFFYVWSQPRMININELSEHSFQLLGYFLNVQVNHSVVRSQMLQNTFLIEIFSKKVDIIVPIIPLIRYLAKAKFCNVLGHPISKPVWADSSDFDIIERFLRICSNLCYYYNGSSKKKGLYQIKYILRLSCIKTLACKHKTTVRAFLNRSGSEELFEGFFAEEDPILPIIGIMNAIHSLILDPDSSTSQRISTNRVWYLDILFSNDLFNDE